MEPKPTLGPQRIPRAVALISLLTLALPAVVGLAFPERLAGPAVVVWIAPLIPLFLLALYRGWQGALLGLLAAVVVLVGTQAVASARGAPVPTNLFHLTLAVIAASVGAAWLAHGLLKDRRNIQDLAFTDLLTQVPNRRYVRTYLDTQFHDAARGRALSLVLFDLDHFKRFNDEHGHEAGDEALKLFAKVLQETTRKSNLSGRLGGEEFVSILSGTEIEGAALFAERVRAAIQAVEVEFGSITVSAGVAQFEAEMKSPDELLAAADHAMYRAKTDGRNCVRVFGRPTLEELVPARSRAELPDPNRDPDPTVPKGGTPQPAQDASIAHSRAGFGAPKRGKPVTLSPHAITGFGKGRSALLVEGDDAVRSLVATYLEKEGLVVREARDLGQAVRQLETEYDLVLIGLQKEDRDGLRLVTGMKARWENTPILALVSLEAPELASDALSAGADQYLLRPFQMADLGACARELLSTRDSRLAEWNSREWAPDFPMAVRTHMDRALEELVAAAEIRETGALGRSQRAEAIGLRLSHALVEQQPDLGIDPEQVALAARLMAIGRTAVPEALLNRVGPLNPSELEEVRMAAGRGADMLSSLGMPPKVVGAIRWHSIRWDGRGQSGVLGGRAIPLEARLLGIVWAFEAMTRDRPYEEARSWSQAVAEITTKMGHQFDPGLSEAFHQALPSLRAVILGDDTE